MPKVNFKRKSTLEIEDLDIEDGSLIYDYETGNTFMDYQNKRIQTGGKPNQDIYIGPEEDAPSEAKIIIDSNQMKTPTNIEQTIDNKLSPIRGTILWTNPDPTQNISADYEINLSSADYDLIEVIYQYSTSGTQQNSSRAVKGKPINLQAYSIGSNMTILVRRMDYINDTKYKLTACSLHQVIGNTVTTNNTSGAIPLYIVGYKTGLFSKEVNE